MGRDKALLEIHGRTLLGRTVEILSGITEDIQVVGRSSLPADCPPTRLTADIAASAGPLGGLHAGLRCAVHDLVICTACDYPFLSPAVLLLLAERAAGHDAAVPRVAATAHVTQAVYSSRLLPAIEAQLAAGHYRVQDVLTGHRVGWVDEAELRPLDPDLRSLMNVNTPEDWEQALVLAGERRS